MSNKEWFVVRALSKEKQEQFKKDPKKKLEHKDFSSEVVTTNDLKIAESCLAGSRKPQAIYELVEVGTTITPFTMEAFRRSNVDALNPIKVIKVVKPKPAERGNRNRRSSNAPVRP